LLGGAFVVEEFIQEDRRESGERVCGLKSTTLEGEQECDGNQGHCSLWLFGSLILVLQVMRV
jgi:hypothetical protein